MIYEQRKTNQILVAGFKSLGQALEHMTWQLTSSIDDLNSSVNAMSSTLNSSLLKIHGQAEQLNSAMTGHRQEVAREASGRADREKKVVEMLDNIQRDRYPSILHGGVV